jgi:hypothetical protein
MSDEAQEMARDADAVKRTVGIVAELFSKRALMYALLFMTLSGGSSYLSARKGNADAVAVLDTNMTRLVHGYAHRIDSVNAAMQSEVDSIEQVEDERYVITRAIGVRMCLKETTDFINYTGLPCDHLLQGLGPRPRGRAPRSPLSGGSGGVMP